MNGASLLSIFGQIIILIVFSPLVAAVIKRTKARLQNRRGPKLFQVYYDLIKLFKKESIISPTVSWIFKIAPFIYLATAIAAAALTPFFAVLVPEAANTFSNVFALIYLFVFGRFFLTLAALDAASAFGGMGASRDLFIAVLVEPALLLSMLTVALKCHSTNLIMMAIVSANTSLGLPVIFAAIAFFIVLIAETGRVPVDNPDTHLELTMAHEGMTIEYSGRWLGLITLASCLKQIILIVLFINLFLPWTASSASLTVKIVFFAAKIIACAMLLGLAETVKNKMRLFRVPNFLAVASLLALLAIVAQ